VHGAYRRALAVGLRCGPTASSCGLDGQSVHYHMTHFGKAVVIWGIFGVLKSRTHQHVFISLLQWLFRMGLVENCEIAKAFELVGGKGGGARTCLEFLE
jgi:hypothetical protein